MIEDKKINTLAENVNIKDNTPQKPQFSGSIFERRFMIYEKMNPSAKVVDFIIIFCVIMLFVFFILGAYIK